MAPPSKKILVFGGTGVIGKVLVQALLNNQDDFERIGMFTSAETVQTKPAMIDSLTSRGIEVIVGDITSDNDVMQAYQRFDTVVSAVGRNVIEKQINLISLAERSSSIVRFIPSEFGTDVVYDESSLTEKPHQMKLKVRSFIESSAVQRLTYTYIVTGPFADLYVGNMPNEPRLGSFDVVKREATLLGDGKGRISLTTMADVGRFLVASLKHPEVSDRKALKVKSFTTTPEAILHEMQRQTGRRFRVQYTPLDDLKAFETKAWDEGSPVASLCTLRRIWTEGKTLYAHNDAESIGVVKTDTVEMVVQAAIMRSSRESQSGPM